MGFLPNEIFLKEPISFMKIYFIPKTKNQSPIGSTLVTQPMLQRQPNHTELRLMDSYIQILYRFQKCKREVPPPSPLFFFLSKPTLGDQRKKSEEKKI